MNLRILRLYTYLSEQSRPRQDKNYSYIINKILIKVSASLYDQFVRLKRREGRIKILLWRNSQVQFQSGRNIQNV